MCLLVEVSSLYTNLSPVHFLTEFWRMTQFSKRTTVILIELKHPLLKVQVTLKKELFLSMGPNETKESFYEGSLRVCPSPRHSQFLLPPKDSDTGRTGVSREPVKEVHCASEYLGKTDRRSRIMKTETVHNL